MKIQWSSLWGVLGLWACCLGGSVAAAPSPQYVTVNIGSQLTLTGLPGDSGTVYQWFKDGSALEDDERISGAQDPTLTIQNADFPDRGTYLLISSLGDNVQTNNLFIVYVLGSSLKPVGSTIVLSGPAGQPEALYQWIKDGSVLQDSDRLTGSETTTLTISQAMPSDSGTYSLTARVSTNAVQTNAVFVVTVLGQPAINHFFTFTRGTEVNFEVDATGGQLAYQWLWQGQPIPGATKSVLTFPNGYFTASAGYYSVVVSNPFGQASPAGPGLLFTKPTPGGTYQGLFFNADPASVTLDSSGFFQYTLSASKRSFSGKLLIRKTAFPFSGSFSPAHDSTVAVPNTSLVLTLQLVATNGTGQVFGTVSSDQWTSTLRANLLVFNAKNLFSRAGSFTLSLQNTNFGDAFRPDGAGFGAVRISPRGAITMSGQAADGTAIAQSCGLAQTGDWPLYVPMYKDRGCLFGWLLVTNRANSSIEGQRIFWLKEAGPDKLYPDGFAVNLQAQGSSYSAPPGTPILSFSDGVAAFSAGDLFADGLVVWDFVRVRRRDPAAFYIAEKSVERLTLSVQRSNGIVTGGFTDLMTGKRAPIRAIILQQQNIAPGFFLSTNASGYFLLAPNR